MFRLCGNNVYDFCSSLSNTLKRKAFPDTPKRKAFPNTLKALYSFWF
jgi:hypothetical protein